MVGSLLIDCQILVGPIVNRIFSVRNRNNIASKDENRTIIFFASQIYGLNKVTLTATGNFESMPSIVGEKSPRLYVDPSSPDIQ